MGKILKVGRIGTGEWPCGDACVCAVMLLRYLGVQITVEEFIDFFLPQEPMHRRDGRLTGPDPAEKFAGSPYERDACGCGAGVIVRALNECFAQKGLSCRAEDATGMSTQELLASSVDQGLPAIYWASRHMAPTHPGVSWTDRAGERSFQVPAGAWCFLLIGTDTGELIFNDPDNLQGPYSCSRILAARRHQELGRQAVVIRLS